MNFFLMSKASKIAKGKFIFFAINIMMHIHALIFESRDVQNHFLGMYIYGIVEVLKHGFRYFK